MALNLQREFAYTEKPIIPVRLTSDRTSVNTEALLDTGASVSLVDAELEPLLAIELDSSVEADILGIGGSVRRIRFSLLEVSVLGAPDDQTWKAEIWVGFVPGLAKSVGSLLGRNFFEHFDFGLHHHAFPAHRRLYLGKP